MIINKLTGRKNVAKGFAKIECITKKNDGTYWCCISDYRVSRTDHYEIQSDDIEFKKPG